MKSFLDIVKDFFDELGLISDSECRNWQEFISAMYPDILPRHYMAHHHQHDFPIGKWGLVLLNCYDPNDCQLALCA